MASGGHALPRTHDALVIGAGQGRPRGQLPSHPDRHRARGARAFEHRVELARAPLGLLLHRHPELVDHPPRGGVRGRRPGRVPRRATSSCAISRRGRAPSTRRSGAGSRRGASGPRAAAFEVATSEGPFRARNVVVATSTYQNPHVPAVAARLPRRLAQLTPHDLQAPGDAAAGRGDGRRLRADRMPDRGGASRGGPGGVSLRGPVRAPPAALARPRLHRVAARHGVPRPDARHAREPRGPVPGRSPPHRPERRLHHQPPRLPSARAPSPRGGSSTARGERARFDGGLHAEMRFADEFCDRIVEQFERHIADRAIDAPPPAAAELAGGPPEDGRLPEIVREVDLAAANVGAVVWATGYRYDFSWIGAPVLDPAGYPRGAGRGERVPGALLRGAQLDDVAQVRNPLRRRRRRAERLRTPRPAALHPIDGSRLRPRRRGGGRLEMTARGPARIR